MRVCEGAEFVPGRRCPPLPADTGHAPTRACPPERHSPECDERERVRVHGFEMTFGILEVRHEERMLVGRSVLGRVAAAQLCQRVVT
jgi:hypothetical protein